MKIFLVLALLFGFASAQLELHFIDVGQGDSILIRSPSGQSVLYDGGRSQDVPLEYLRRIGVKSLDLVVASHADADHIGGLAAVIRAYHPRFFMNNELPHTTQTYEDLLLAVQEAGSQVIAPTARRIGLGDAALQVIPPPGDEGLDSNNNSVGLVVSYGEFRAALTGDAEAPEFGWWQANAPGLLSDVDVYKSAHHSSENGDSAASMAAWQPETIVISVGEGNTYGHPEPETLALYASGGADVYRTDQSGTVVVSATADGRYTVSTEPSGAPTVVPTESPKTEPVQALPFDPSGEDRDCGDFSSQVEAQAFYEAAGPGDTHELDSEGDGVACESL